MVCLLIRFSRPTCLLHDNQQPLWRENWRKASHHPLTSLSESPPHPDLLTSPNVTIHPLAIPPRILTSSSIPFIISGPLKVLWQVGTLLHVLGYTTPASTWLLVQVNHQPIYLTLLYFSQDTNRSPEPPFHPNPSHILRGLYPAQHTAHDRLAQLRLDDPLRHKRPITSLRSDIQGV